LQSTALYRFPPLHLDLTNLHTTAYYRGAKGIFLVYDVTNELSFRHVKVWMDNIEKLADDSVSVMLIGNKCDSNKRVSEGRGYRD